jgi:hypothetical protein
MQVGEAVYTFFVTRNPKIKRGFSLFVDLRGVKPEIRTKRFHSRIFLEFKINCPETVIIDITTKY